MLAEWQSLASFHDASHLELETHLVSFTEILSFEFSSLD